MDAEPGQVGVVRVAVESWLRAVRWPVVESEEIVFAVSEVVSNSVEHAYLGPWIGRVDVDLVVRAVPRGRFLRITVTDGGRWRAGPPDPGRGNGLAVVRMMVASLEVEHDDDGTRVLLLSTPVADARRLPEPGTGT